MTRSAAKVRDEANFCPRCGSTWLGGVMGDLTILGCYDCHQTVDKYLKERPAHDKDAA